jgi:hypothetical protein
MTINQLRDATRRLSLSPPHSRIGLSILDPSVERQGSGGGAGVKRVRFSGRHQHHSWPTSASPFAPASASAAVDKGRLYGVVPRTMWQAVFEYLYGQVPEGDLLPMISTLSSILFVIIGGFWLLDSLKDTVFASIVGLRSVRRSVLGHRCGRRGRAGGLLGLQLGGSW